MKKNKDEFAAWFCGRPADYPCFFLGTMPDGRKKFRGSILPETEEDLREAIQEEKEQKLKKQVDSWDSMRDDMRADLEYYKKKSGAV